MAVNSRLTEITICAFAGPETSPIQRAQEAGWFAGEGLAVRCEVATGSVQQMVGLIDGDYDMAMSAVDNAVAYNERQGAATPNNPADLVVILGCATDPRPLIARPEIATFDDLRGRRIAVDAVSTGFSFMLRQLLEDNGLGMQHYELVPVGAIKARWDAVRSGDCAAGLLGKADAAAAELQGYIRLRGDPDPWDTYQGGVFIVRRDWAAAHRTQVIGFIRAMLRATEWVLGAKNAGELPGLLMRHLPHLNLSQADAERAATALQSPQSILKPGLPIDPAGMEAVLRLRRKYGTPPAEIGDAGKYVDLGYYRAAIA